MSRDNNITDDELEQDLEILKTATVGVVFGVATLQLADKYTTFERDTIAKYLVSVFTLGGIVTQSIEIPDED